MRRIRRRLGHAWPHPTRAQRQGYTWTVASSLNGSATEALLDYYERGGSKPSMSSFRSKQKAEQEVERLLHHGYDAVKFKWWHAEPHFRGVWS